MDSMEGIRLPVHMFRINLYISSTALFVTVLWHIIHDMIRFYQYFALLTTSAAALSLLACAGMVVTLVLLIVDRIRTQVPDLLHASGALLFSLVMGANSLYMMLISGIY